MVFSKYTKHETKQKQKTKKNLISSSQPTKELTKWRFLRVPLKRLILSSGISEFFKGILDHTIFFKKIQNMPKKGHQNHAWSAGQPRMKFYTQAHENWCHWCSASTLKVKENKNKNKKNLISSPRPTKELLTLQWAEVLISDFFLCFCFLLYLVYLLNTIDTNFHGPKYRIAFSVILPTPGIWGLLFVSLTLLKKVGYLKIVSYFLFINRF